MNLVWNVYEHYFYDAENNGCLDKEEYAKFAESYISLDDDLKIGHKDVFSAVFRKYDKD
jgi:hypothetical protein